MIYVLPEPLVLVQLMQTPAVRERKTEAGIILPEEQKINPDDEQPDEAEFGKLLSPVYLRDKDGNKTSKDGSAEQILFKAGMMVAFPRLQGVKINDPETGDQLKIIEDEFIIAQVIQTDEKEVSVQS